MQARIAEKMAQRDNAENAWMGWICPCGGKNLTMKARCTLCGQVKPLSAQQRGVGQAAAAIERARRDTPSPRRRPQSRTPRTPPARKRRSRSRSRSSSSKSSSSKSATEKPDDATEAKRLAMQHLQNLQDMKDGKEKQKAYRKLLREWHPDKNPDKVKMATEVFQFLQKASGLFKC